MKKKVKIIIIAVLLPVVLVSVISLSNRVYDLCYGGSENIFIAGVPHEGLTFQIEALLIAAAENHINENLDPEIIASILSRAYHVVTGKILDYNYGYRSLILSIIVKETGFRTHKKLLSWLPVPEFFGNSFGLMQAKDVTESDLYESMLQSIRKLDNIVQIYAKNREINNQNVKYIITDWCIGPNSCKIASLQNLLNKKLKLSNLLALDGDIGIRTAFALNMIKKYKKTDANNIIDSSLLAIELKNYEMVNRYRKYFLKTDYYKQLLVLYPEIENPILAYARVNDLRMIQNILSGESGWLSSKEYTEEVFAIYQQI